jgi:hypothetical protein
MRDVAPRDLVDLGGRAGDNTPLECQIRPDLEARRIRPAALAADERESDRDDERVAIFPVALPLESAPTAECTRKTRRRSESISRRRLYLLKWAWVELNYRPHAYQACALTT